MTDAPRDVPRDPPPLAPSAGKKLAASATVFVGLFAVALGLVGMVEATTVAGAVLAGFGFVGGGSLLLGLSWRLYRGIPGLAAHTAGLPPEEARRTASTFAARRWRRCAKFMVVLMVGYLLLGHPAAVVAGLTAALTAAALALLAWRESRRSG